MVQRILFSWDDEIRLRAPRGTTREIAATIEFALAAGFPVEKAVSLIADSVPKHKERLKDLAALLGEGWSLSEALGSFPEIFPGDLVTMVRASEEGRVPPAGFFRVWSRCSDLVHSARRGILDFVMYPVLLLLATAGVTFLMAVFVLPTFEKVFQGFLQSLPFLTRVLAAIPWRAISSGLFWVMVALIVLGALFLERGWGKKRRPLLLPSKIGMLHDWNQGLRLLDALLAAEMELSAALGLAAGSLRAGKVAKAVARVGSRVGEGTRLSDALHAEPVAPRSLPWILAWAEEKGDLGGGLLQAAGLIENRILSESRRFAFFLLILAYVPSAIFIGFVIFGIYLPIFDLPGLLG